MNQKKKIACAILAGGKSSRMGQDKASLKIREETFLEIICRTMEKTKLFEERIIAVGSRSLPEREGWQQVEDIYPMRGPMAGIHGVLTASSADAVFFISCDMPLISKGLVERMYKNFYHEDILAVKTQDGRGHPLCGIYRTSLGKKAEEAILAQNYRISGLLDKSNVNWFFPSDEEEVCLTNINTPEEYQELIRRIEGVSR